MGQKLTSTNTRDYKESYIMIDFAAIAKKDLVLL